MKKKMKLKDEFLIATIITVAIMFILFLFYTFLFHIFAKLPLIQSALLGLSGFIGYALLDIIGCTLDDFLEKRRKNKKK
jgi:hypothetical protein